MSKRFTKKYSSRRVDRPASRYFSNVSDGSVHGIVFTEMGIVVVTKTGFGKGVKIVYECSYENTVYKLTETGINRVRRGMSTIAAGFVALLDNGYLDPDTGELR